MKRPYAGIFVTCLTDKRQRAIVEAVDEDIFISVFPAGSLEGFKFALNRNVARLLARRINACLDATKK